VRDRSGNSDPSVDCIRLLIPLFKHLECDGGCPVFWRSGCKRGDAERFSEGVPAHDVTRNSSSAVTVIVAMCIAANSVRKRVGVKSAVYIVAAIAKAHWVEQTIETERGPVGDG